MITVENGDMISPDLQIYEKKFTKKSRDTSEANVSISLKDPESDLFKSKNLDKLEFCSIKNVFSKCFLNVHEKLADGKLSDERIQFFLYFVGKKSFF